MSDWNQPWVLDREAYHERMAIMMEALMAEHPSPTQHQLSMVTSEASESAHKTPFAVAATAAARGDWEPAKALCRGERSRRGESAGRELMRAIQDAVREKMGESQAG